MNHHKFNDQKLHIIATYFNPYRYHSRLKLARDFVHHMRASENVALHVVEVAFGDRPFELASTPHDVFLRTNHALWSKENALNIGVQRLPHDWKYAGYIDADFHFTRKDWALETIHQLQHYPWVQMYSSYSPMGPGHIPSQVRPSFAYAYHNYFGGKPKTHIEKTPRTVAAKSTGGVKFYHIGEQEGATQTEWDTLKRNTNPGATGGAWAWTREGFDSVGGLLDTCILGAADWYMSFGLVGNRADGHPEAVSCGPAYEESIRRWQDRAFAAIKGKIGYVDNFATHAWHGDLKNRGYGTRWQILRDHAYDPAIDVTRDWQGLLKFTGNKPGLEADVVRYFLSRNEDSTEFFGKGLV